MNKTAEKTAYNETSVSNGAERIIGMSQPYRVMVKIKGACPIVFHAWNCESVDAKSKAAKGSAAKKTDDVESFVYRNEKGEIGIPGTYLIGACIGAAKFKQDPRSPRKCAADLFKAAVCSLTPLASLGTKQWDFLDRRRVTVQRNSVTRTRPAMLEGWEATFILQCLLPEYINPQFLNEIIAMAGKLIGLADMRPSFGRYSVVEFTVLDD